MKRCPAINNTDLKLAYVSAIVNATIIGFSFLFVKIALEYGRPIDTLTYRFALSFGMMSIPVLLGRVKVNYRNKPIFILLLLTIINPVAFFAFQAFGIEQASSSEAGMIYAVTPVLTMMLASLFLRENTSHLQKLSIFVSAFGVIYIFMMKGSSIDVSNLTGLFLLFLSSLAIAVYTVLARSLLTSTSPAEISYMMLGGGFVSFLCISVIDHTAHGTFDQFIAPLTSIPFILSILYLGILSSLVTSLAANYSLTKLSASKMSVFSNLSTVVSIIAGVLFLGETIEMYHIIGSALIIAGVMGTNHWGRKKASVQG